MRQRNKSHKEAVDRRRSRTAVASLAREAGNEHRHCNIITLEPSFAVVSGK